MEFISELTILVSIYFLFGLIIGSFLNVLVGRYRVKTLGGRSKCASCAHVLAWYDLVPVLSFLFLRGRCRYCGSGLSVQYPLVELTTAILFSLVGAAGLPSLSSIFALGCVSLFVAITVYDIHHKIIPDEWSYSAALIALLFRLSIQNSDWQFLIIAGPLAALPLLLLALLAQGKYMGLGDSKLALSLGWLLGFPLGLFAILASFIVGAVTLVPLVALGSLREKAPRKVANTTWFKLVPRGLTMKSEVPFGPFLIGTSLALWLLQLYGFDIFGMLFSV